MEHKIRLLLPKLFFIFSSTILLLCLYSRIFCNGYLFEQRLLFVMSDSMEPTIKTGSLIVAHKLQDDEAVSVGDIITFPVNGLEVTHRIVDIQANGSIITKGDNNQDVDNFGTIIRKDVTDKINVNSEGEVTNIIPVFLFPFIAFYFIQKFTMEKDGSENTDNIK